MHTLHRSSLPGSPAVLLLTRGEVVRARTRLTVAVVVEEPRGLWIELAVGPRNGMREGCAVNLDDVRTVAKNRIGAVVGYLTARQEDELTRAALNAWDLTIHRESR